MSAVAGSVRPAVGSSNVQQWYLQAVVRVYEPWTTSKTINSKERALAVQRVRHASHVLADLEAQMPRENSGRWTAASG